MSGVNDQKFEDGVFEDVATPCVALVPVAQPLHHAPRSVRTRPDATFVTQLIATAEHVPQTRELRRAAPVEAASAYRAFQHGTAGAGRSTRQTV